MSCRECHLNGCQALVHLRGDGSAFFSHDGGVKVFFCSLEHQVDFEERQARRSLPPDTSEQPFFDGFGPEVMQ